MIKKIRASREQVEAERDEKGVDIDPSLAKHTGYDGVWQPVAGTRHKFYVYSAFYDDRARPIVRVVAATRTKRSDKVRTPRSFMENTTYFYLTNHLSLAGFKFPLFLTVGLLPVERCFNLG